MSGEVEFGMRSWLSGKRTVILGIIALWISIFSQPCAAELHDLENTTTREDNSRLGTTIDLTTRNQTDDDNLSTPILPTGSGDASLIVAITVPILVVILIISLLIVAAILYRKRGRQKYPAPIMPTPDDIDKIIDISRSTDDEPKLIYIASNPTSEASNESEGTTPEKPDRKWNVETSSDRSGEDHTQLSSNQLNFELTRQFANRHPKTEQEIQSVSESAEAGYTNHAYINESDQPMDQTRLEVPCVAEQADYLMLVQDSEDVTPNEKHDSYMVPDSHRDNTEEQSNRQHHGEYVEPYHVHVMSDVRLTPDMTSVSASLQRLPATPPEPDDYSPVYELRHPVTGKLIHAATRLNIVNQGGYVNVNVNVNMNDGEHKSMPPDIKDNSPKEHRGIQESYYQNVCR